MVQELKELLKLEQKIIPGAASIKEYLLQKKLNKSEYKPLKKDIRMDGVLGIEGKREKDL